MAHHIKHYAAIGGLMRHAKYGSHTLSRSGVVAREANLLEKFRAYTDVAEADDPDEFERRWQSYRSGHYRRLSLRRGGTEGP